MDLMLKKLNNLEKSIGPSLRHGGQFYESESFLLSQVSAYIADGLNEEEGVLVVIRLEHIPPIKLHLKRLGYNIPELLKNDHLCFYDAHELLLSFMIEDIPSRSMFFKNIEPIILKLKNKHKKIRVFGEMVSLLVEQNNYQSAIALEEFWNELIHKDSFSLLCGYSLEHFSSSAEIDHFKSLCDLHGYICPSEDYQGDNPSLESSRLINECRQKSLAIKNELSRTQMAIESKKAMNEFICNMSHEIRTPLSAIIGYCELLKNPDLMEHEKNKTLDIIIRNGKNLNSLVSDILDLSKVEAGRLNFNPSKISLKNLLNEIVSLFSAQALEKSIDLSFEIGHQVSETLFADSNRIRQILINLTSNAIKFTSRGNIQILVKNFTNQSHKTITGFFIKDTGCGISKDDRKKLFITFSQCDSSTSRSFGGTGIGLTLSKSLAKAMGGDVILLESTVNVGSTFLFTIDNQEEESINLKSAKNNMKEQETQNSHEIFKFLRILVVEDNLDLQDLISIILSNHGAKIDRTSNGRDAFELVKKNVYDIIFMDLQMPIMDGYTSIVKMRKENYRGPVIALSAHATVEDRDTCLQSGFDDYIVKPFTFEKLIQTVHKYSQNAVGAF